MFDVTEVFVQYSSAQYASGETASPSPGVVAAPAAGAAISEAATTVPDARAASFFLIFIRMVRSL